MNPLSSTGGAQNKPKANPNKPNFVSSKGQGEIRVRSSAAAGVNFLPAPEPRTGRNQNIPASVPGMLSLLLVISESGYAPTAGFTPSRSRLPFSR
jgi:hypothetical protein